MKKIKPISYKKKAQNRKISISKENNAKDTIGKIEKNTDCFILTYGQFSLIDALIAILDQTGPAHVVISTWTAADAHLERSAQLLESADILSLKMIVDISFKARQPKYHAHMLNLFGNDCIRAIKTHAKFMLIRNEAWDVVCRTSMNLNGNPRLENIEISESKSFADFFQKVTDAVFEEVPPDQRKNDMLKLRQLEEAQPYQLVQANHRKRSSLNEPEISHVIKRLSKSRGAG